MFYFKTCARFRVAQVISPDCGNVFNCAPPQCGLSHDVGSPQSCATIGIAVRYTAVDVGFAQNRRGIIEKFRRKAAAVRGWIAAGFCCRIGLG